MRDRADTKLAGRNLRALKRQAAKERAELAREAIEAIVAVPALGDVIYSLADEPIYAMVGFVNNDDLQLCMVAKYGVVEAPMYVLPLAQLMWDPSAPERRVVEEGRWRLKTTSRIIADTPAAQGGLVVVG